MEKNKGSVFVHGKKVEVPFIKVEKGFKIPFPKDLKINKKRKK